MTTLFAKKVLEIVGKIPRGKTMTYKEVAIKAGSKNAARAIGTIMKGNYNPKIPCHRVIKSDSTPGDYNRGGPKGKASKLRAEGAI